MTSAPWQEFSVPTTGKGQSSVSTAIDINVDHHSSLTLISGETFLSLLGGAEWIKDIFHSIFCLPSVEHMAKIS